MLLGLEQTIAKQIIGTVGIRNLKQYASTCELKRMYVLKDYRRLEIGGKMLISQWILLKD
jgi:hypothetical protein